MYYALKTVCLTGTGVRIPQPAPKNTNFSVGVFLFFVFNLCAVTMGEERKTVDNCFSRTKSTKQREMKQGYALSTFRLCDLTGHVELKTVRPKATGSSHTAAAEYITRNKVFAVSASRGDVGLNLYRSGTVSTILAPSSIPLFLRQKSNAVSIEVSYLSFFRPIFVNFNCRYMWG